MIISDHNPLRLIGAIAPSSRFLAHAMTRFIEEKPHAMNILEVGAGTGAITKTLVSKMHDGQRSDIVEIFPKLAILLSTRFANQKTVFVHCSDIRDFESKVGYDLVICSLPFNAFLPHKTRVVLERLVGLSNQQAIMSFFEYKIIQRMAPIFLNRQRLEQFYRSRSLIDRFVARFKFDEQAINLNIPPAVVHYLSIDKTVNCSSILES